MGRARGGTGGEAEAAPPRAVYARFDKSAKKKSGKNPHPARASRVQSR